MNFKEVGKQEVYCIVHSEVYTFAKYFKEKGLKHVHYMAGFPKHSIGVIDGLINLGFNSRENIEVNNCQIRPIDFTVQVLKKIKTPEGYNEVENLWIRMEGMKNGRKKKTELNCIIRTLDNWKEAGSNVDTGRTISIMSQMIYNGMIKEKGVYAPEAVVPHRWFFKELAKRKMYVYQDGKKIN
jgi:lysine 6-dehydrogenase